MRARERAEAAARRSADDHQASRRAQDARQLADRRTRSSARIAPRSPPVSSTIATSKSLASSGSRVGGATSTSTRTPALSAPFRALARPTLRRAPPATARPDKPTLPATAPAVRRARSRSARGGRPSSRRPCRRRAGTGRRVSETFRSSQLSALSSVSFQLTAHHPELLLRAESGWLRALNADS